MGPRMPDFSNKGNKIHKSKNDEFRSFPIKENIPEGLEKVKVSYFNYGSTVSFSVKMKRIFIPAKPLGSIFFNKFSYSDLFRGFLNKFGKKSGSQFNSEPLFFREEWEIDYHVLLAGYTLIKRNPEEFKEIMESAKSPDDFIIRAGIR